MSKIRRRQLLLPIALVALVLWGTGCDSASQPAGEQAGGTINVLAAASLNGAFTEIGKNFAAANPNSKVVFSFAGSQQLAQQINQGAPADVFASANSAQMNVVINAGAIVSGTQQTFGRNRLVVIIAKRNAAGVSSLQDLAKPHLKLILAAKEVPVGQYSLDFLDKASKDAAFGSDYKDKVLQNVVSYEQDVKAVFTKISLGEGDAGIVYSSDAMGTGQENISRLEIPDALNTIASYPIAPTKESKNPQLAREFISYVLSNAGQQVLAKYGFITTSSTK